MDDDKYDVDDVLDDILQRGSLDVAALMNHLICILF
jgi:hypothetical protein